MQCLLSVVNCTFMKLLLFSFLCKKISVSVILTGSPCKFDGLEKANLKDLRQTKLTIKRNGCMHGIKQLQRKSFMHIDHVDKMLCSVNVGSTAYTGL